MPDKRKPGKTDKGPAPEDSLDSTGALTRGMVERMMRSFGKADSQHRSDEERAQELVYEAMEAQSPKDLLKLIGGALELDPFNVDARLILLDLTVDSTEERIDTLRDIVEKGAMKLGSKVFKEMAPHFWGFTETRPYMRARMQLAEELRTARRIEEAVKEYEEMLDLNENDNQGVRYQLLPSYLVLSRLEDARKLMKKFPDEENYNPAFAWGRVLERHLSRDDPGSAKALAVARKQNPHMEAFLKGHRQLPKNQPNSYTLGSREEAICFAEVLIAAWHQHPEALGWLVMQKPGKPAATKEGKP